MLRQAATLAPGAVIETVAEDLIVAGQVMRDYDAGPRRWVILGPGWTAQAERRPSPLGTRRGWCLLAVHSAAPRPPLPLRTRQPPRQVACPAGAYVSAEDARTALEARLEELLAETTA